MKAKRKTWTQRIAAARRAGAFTPDDVDAATRWNTCAIGEVVGYPVTEELALTRMRKNPVLDGSGLGIKFVDAVSRGHIEEAAKILKLIKVAARG